MSINLTDEIEVKTKKGKLGAAKQIFLEGDTQTVENEIQDINSRHNDLNSKHESLSSTVSEHTNQIESNQNQITANKSTQDAKNASLDANMAKLNTRDDQITELVRGITATGGASVATTVTYDNTSSHLASVTVQGAIDELQGSKIDKTSILQKLGNAEDKVISQKAVTEAINKLKNAGYLYAGIATPTTNPGTPEGPVFYIANGKGTYTNFGGIDVTEDDVVVLCYDTVWHKEATGIASQSKLTELSEEKGKFDDDAIYVSDAKGNLIATINADGIRTTDVEVEGGKVSQLFAAILSKLDKEIDSDFFQIQDTNGNIAFRVDNRGVHSIKSDSWVVSVVLGDAYIPTSILRNEKGDVASAEIIFPDGQKGNIVITNQDANGVKEMTIGYNNKNIGVVINRDSQGNVSKININ